MPALAEAVGLARRLVLGFVFLVPDLFEAPVAVVLVDPDEDFASFRRYVGALDEVVERSVEGRPFVGRVRADGGRAGTGLVCPVPGEEVLDEVVGCIAALG